MNLQAKNKNGKHEMNINCNSDLCNITANDTAQLTKITREMKDNTFFRKGGFKNIPSKSNICPIRIIIANNCPWLNLTTAKRRSGSKIRSGIIM